MPAPVILSEIPVSLDYQGSYRDVSLAVYDPKARAIETLVRKEAVPGGLPREMPCVVVRDRGFVARPPKNYLQVVICRRIGESTPIPDHAGRVIGRIRMDLQEWIVCERVLPKDVTASARPDPVAEDTRQDAGPPVPRETSATPKDEPWPL